MFSLKVKQGTLKKEDSSCTPPESVIINLEFFCKHIKSTYPNGSVIISESILLYLSYKPNLLKLLLVLGCIGKTHLTNLETSTIESIISIK